MNEKIFERVYYTIQLYSVNPFDPDDGSWVPIMEMGLDKAFKTEAEAIEYIKKTFAATTRWRIVEHYKRSQVCNTICSG